MYSSDEVSFSVYVAILGQSAMMHLGKIMNPATGKLERDLVQAKFTIDILGMLEEKTKGNLTKDEADLLRTTLANLRLNYVEEVEEEKKRQEEGQKRQAGKEKGKVEENKGKKTEKKEQKAEETGKKRDERVKETEKTTKNKKSKKEEE